MAELSAKLQELRWEELELIEQIATTTLEVRILKDRLQIVQLNISQLRLEEEPQCPSTSRK